MGWMALAIAAAGCAALSLPEGPTPIPADELPTIIALTVEAGSQANLAVIPEAEQPTPFGNDSPTLQTAAATASPGSQENTPTVDSTTPPRITSTVPEQTPTPDRPSATPSPTPGIPDAAIQVLDPGPASKVVSPIRISAYLRPGVDGRVHLELLGEDGRLLVRKVIPYSLTSTRVYLLEELDFEIAAVAETARLLISTFDAQGRTIALASVDLILMSVGSPDMNPPGDLGERLVILEPAPNKLIQGGALEISGMARTSAERPLMVELVAGDGRIVGYRQAAVLPSPDGGHVPFSVEVPYSVTAPTWARLVVREESSGRIPGTTHLSSVEVLLSP